MHRLFVALRPPPVLRRQLLDTMGGVPGARWQDEDQLHLTLHFVGEVERPRAEDIAAGLDRVREPCPVVRLAGVGTFDRKGRVHTLWAGIAHDAGLHALQRRIERALVLAGAMPETRAFHPHVTLARLGRDAGPIEPFLRRHAGLASAAFQCDAFILFESSLGSAGATYSAVARYPLH